MAESWRAREEDVDAIAAAREDDPFAVLGPHRTPAGWVLRAFVPDAISVRALTREGAPIADLERRKGDFFEALLPNVSERPTYRIEATRVAGVSSYEDAYAFGPGLGPMDDYLLIEGSHRQLYKRLGAQITVHEGVGGVLFALWAPNARRVSVVGDFNEWDGRRCQMRKRIDSGLWEIFIPHLGAGIVYKYEIVGADGVMQPLKADPYGFEAELRPSTASVVAYTTDYPWNDDDYLTERARPEARRKPMSILEVHLGSWRRGENGRFLSYDELSEQLIPYAVDLGFTHLELMPVTEHPLDDSWGYQPIGLFAPTRRFGAPDAFARFVDRAHIAGLGVILDWVPAHFPVDAHGLAHFDGSPLYEHADPRKGFHPDWNTAIYDFGRREVANFLLTSALYWVDRYHVDGLRVDAVASMLYLDYSRKPGEWLPNAQGGNENLDAIAFLKRANEAVYGEFPGAVTIAEELTAFPGVSRPTNFGGLGFGFKWNMGWMHDTLDYMSKDPIYRRWSHHKMTFGLLYAFTENFILPISHDEVVYGKRSVVSKMPGDEWQRFANTRAYYGFMWGHPGKKLLFMGQEFGQTSEWNANDSLPWWLLDHAPHQGLLALVRDLNALYRSLPALHARDCEVEGFRWIVVDDENQSVYAFLRTGAETDRPVAVVCNFTPEVRRDYRIGLPSPGRWREALNTDAAVYGGSNIGNMGGVWAEPQPAHGLVASVGLTLPPLATLFLEFDPAESLAPSRGSGPLSLEEAFMSSPKASKEAAPAPPFARHAMAYVLAGGRGSRLMELTDRRAKPAVYFGGKSRIIDFALSNALNSGIRRIAVATQYKAHSLIRHLQRGWNFFRPERNESFDILPASQRVSETMWYLGTADAVYQNIDIIDGYAPQYMVILAGDHVYKMDYEKMLQQHVESGADVTVGCLEASLEEAKGFGVMHVDTENRILSFLEKPKNPPSMPGKPEVALCSMGIYVFDTKFLIEELRRDAADPNSAHDFGKDIIPYLVSKGKAVAHHFSTSCVVSTEEAHIYWRDAGTVDAFWAANIDLTDIVPDLDLYDRAWPIWTYGEITPPAKFVHDVDGRRGVAISSLVSGGCIVSGAAISRSLVFTGGRVHSFSTIHEAVILPYVHIGRNVTLRKVVVDAEVRIPEGLVVGEDPELDAKRFRRTESGVTLITQPMIDKLNL